jgi:preprotein translocase subunit SecD
MTGGTAPKKRVRLAVLAALAVVAVLGAILARRSPSTRSSRTKLEVHFVDDDRDLFATIADAELPDGIQVRFENVPAGGGNDGSGGMRRSTFARVFARKGESIPDAIARGDAFVKRLSLPEGTRMVWGPVQDWDDDTQAVTVTGARTFLLRSEPVLTTPDVIAAEPVLSDAGGRAEFVVSVLLSESAARRFARATAENVHRRLAIVLDGYVDSAPVIREPISGGRLVITVGAGDPAVQKEGARRLADGLAGR